MKKTLNEIIKPERSLAYLMKLIFRLLIIFRWANASIMGTILLLAPVISSACQQADLVLLNGNFATMDESQPTAAAIAIRGDRVLAIGSDDQIRKVITTDTRVVDLEGRFAMPGIIEGHGHFVGLGESLMMLDLSKAKSWDEIVAQVAEAAKSTPSGQWIVGRGWHQSKWNQKPEPQVDGYPAHNSLSAVSPNHPVLLTHASGHMNFANEYAMRLAKVDGSTQPPRGGEILKDESGQPIGVFRETAQGLISQAYDSDARRKSEAQRNAEFGQAVELALANCLEHGITSFQDAGSSFEVVDQLRKFADSGKLSVRLYVMIRDENDRIRAKLKQYKMIGVGNEFLTVRALKRSIDGALGPHGAWLLAPYQDMPSSSGLNTATIDSVTETAELAIKHGFQMCVHAIGDRANRETLDIFEKMFHAHPSNQPRRWRVEHAQHLDPADIPRFAKMNVIASMQGIHCTSDAIFVPQRLGMRRSKEGAYVWRSLIDSGAIVTNGSDVPVESINPFESIYASVTRKLSNDMDFFPEQCMTRDEALKSYTIDCAYAAFEETLKGSLVPGKLADIVVLDRNLLACPAEEIRGAKVQLTIVGGQVRYQSGLDAEDLDEWP
jgi:predicted amidohydrolase YtcJ